MGILSTKISEIATSWLHARFKTFQQVQQRAHAAIHIHIRTLLSKRSLRDGKSITI